MKKRLFFLLAALLLLVSAVAGVFFYRQALTRHLSILRRDVHHKAVMTQDRLLLLSEKGKPDWREAALAGADLSGCRVTFVDGDGKRLADSLLDESQYYSFVYDTEVLFARNGEVASSIFTDPVTGLPTLFLACPAILVGDTPVIVRLAYPMADYAALRRTITFFVLSLLVVEALLIALCYHYYGGKLEKAVFGGGDSDKEELQRQLERLEQIRSMTDRRNSRISSLIANLEDGLLVVDRDNRVTLVNPRAEELLEIPKAVFFKEDRGEGLIRGCALQALEWTAWSLEDQQDHGGVLENSGKRVLQVQATPMYNKYLPYDLIGAQATVKDITDMRRLENLRRDFVANVSHELRTPLTAISGFSEMLRTDDGLSREEQTSALNIIGTETERLGQLISELLTLSGIENELSGDYVKEEIPALQILEQVVASLQPRARSKDILLTLKTEGRLKGLYGSAERFRRIVVNLCENAVKYTPAKGRVEIKACRRDGGFWMRVKDNGPGIPAEDLPRIFERFYRVDKARNRREGGSGLGLAIVHHIVREWGGKITAQSREGKGSTFTVWLPDVRFHNVQPPKE